MFSLNCLMPVPLGGGPFLSMTLSHSLFDHFEFSTEQNIFVRIQFVFVHSEQFQVHAGNGFDQTFVACRQLKLRKRQAATEPVVDRDNPTWQLTITGQLTLDPTNVAQRASKSLSKGLAELQIGIRTWFKPGNFSLTPAITSVKLMISFASISLSFLETSTTLSFPPSSSAFFFNIRWNSASSFSTDSRVTSPNSAYSPILFGGLAQTGFPLTYKIGSCLMLSQIMGPSLGHLSPQAFSRAFSNPSLVG